MEFGIKKCGVIIMNREKIKATDGIELPSGEWKDEGYKQMDMNT